MNNINALNENIFENIIENLPKTIGLDNVLIIDYLPIRKIEEFISRLTENEFIISEFNGTDQDWGDLVQIFGNNYEIWGSAKEGNLCFELKILNNGI